MNKRQAKKEIKKRYGVSVPRGENPKHFRIFIINLIDITANAIAEYIDGEIIKGKAQ